MNTQHKVDDTFDDDVNRVIKKRREEGTIPTLVSDEYIKEKIAFWVTNKHSSPNKTAEEHVESVLIHWRGWL